MVKQTVGVIGWIGTALVFGAVAIRFLRPEWMQYGTWLTWAGLVCILLYMVGQWRDVVTFYGRRQARYGTISIVGILVGLGILIAVNYLAARQNKRWDLTENQAFSLSEQSVKILRRPRFARPVHRLRPGNELRSVPRSARRLRLRVGQGQRRIRGRGPAAGTGQASRSPVVRDGRHLLQGSDAAGDEHRRAGHYQRTDQGSDGPGEEGLLHAGPRRARYRGVRSPRLRHHHGRARPRQLLGRGPGGCSADARCPPTRRWS